MGEKIFHVLFKGVSLLEMAQITFFDLTSKMISAKKLRY